MSLQSSRENIKNALERCEGVRAAYTRPGHYAKGDAFPVLSAIDGNGFAGSPVTWSATVVLGQDLAVAEDLLDALVLSMRENLKPVMTLTRFTVGTMLIEGGQVYVAQQAGIIELEDDDDEFVAFGNA